MCRPSISVLVGVVCVLFQMVAGWMVWGQSMQFAVRLLHRYCWSLAAVLVTQLCPTLCDPMGCSPPGSSVHDILQARILEWVAIPSPGDLPDPGIEPASPELTGRFSTAEPPGKGCC